MKGCTPCHAHSLPQFRLRAVALVRVGKPITRAAEELGVSAAALHGWVRQDKIDRGELPEVLTAESTELKKAKKCIHEFEMEIEILRRAPKLLGEDRTHPKGFTR